MERLAVGQRYDAEVLPEFGDEAPAADPTVRLHLHRLGLSHRPLAPVEADERALPQDAALEVLGLLHAPKVRWARA